MNEPETDLTSTEARARLARFGPNAMPEAASDLWRRALSRFWAPVPWMLELAIAVQLVMGAFVQAAVIAALLVFNGVLGLFQESRARKTLDALKARLALTAAVRRDGVWNTVPAPDLVPGDLVKLSLGGMVAADVRILSGDVLLDQSTLTGESLPVEGVTGTGAFAGTLIRRGEAVARVTATGTKTKFGRAAELVRTAHGVSAQQAAVLRVVRNLAIFNAGIVVFQAFYAGRLGLGVPEIANLLLTAILAAIPVALPATFTLAGAVGARALAALDVLPTRLSAVDEAATMDVLCVDKTGTLTRNELTVSEVRPMTGFDAARVSALASMASSDGGQDPVDTAVRAAAKPDSDTGTLLRFIPFDPARKMAEAIARDPAGAEYRVAKGAFSVIFAMVPPVEGALEASRALEAKGYRVLGVATGPDGAMRLAGMIALSDPPREDSKTLIAELKTMGIRVLMLTGDSATTAATVARAVGLSGQAQKAEEPLTDQTAVVAGVLPEDKYRIVKTLQAGGHTVGMCGDGANDAPALRQAQIGIAVSTATDVAKAAAGIVLTRPGLTGIVASVVEGRRTFQRIVTYCLRSLTRKTDQMLFLTAGLIMTGHAILTPALMVIMMLTGDFLAMAATTDNVRPSPLPNVWRIDHLSIAGLILACCNLAFCAAILAGGLYWLGMTLDELRTLAIVVLVFSGQAVLYVVRERERLWGSRPSTWLIASSCTDIAIVCALALTGTFMTALPVWIVLGVLGASAVFALVLDSVKLAVFSRVRVV